MSSASTILLTTIPSPDRGVWELGPFPIRAYALCIIVGILVAIWWAERRWVARGGAAGAVVDIAIFAVPFGLVGARLYHVITDWYRYFGEGKNPLNALKIWDGGLGVWGAIALGAVGAWIACRRKGIPLPAMADAAAPGILVAQAIGRLGNYFNQELYGGHTDLPWGLEVYQRFDPNDPSLVNQGPDGVAFGNIPLPESPVHPTFLYELLWCFAIAALVVWADRRFRLGHGRVFALYVAGYTAGRCWIELLRTDDATIVFGLRINVWTSILVFIGAVVYFVLAARRGPREDPVTLLGKKAQSAQGPQNAESPEGRQDDGDSGTGADSSNDTDGNAENAENAASVDCADSADSAEDVSGADTKSEQSNSTQKRE